MDAPAPLVAIVCPTSVASALAAALAGEFTVVTCDAAAIDARDPRLAVVIADAGVPILGEGAPGAALRVTVGAQGATAQPAAFYCLTGALEPEQLRAVVRAAQAAWFAARGATASGPGAVEPGWAGVVRALRLCSDPAQLARTISQAIEALIGDSCDRVLALDAAGWVEHSDAEGARAVALDRGLLGFAARTGESMRVAHAQRDPRWIPSVDDPDGMGSQHVLVATAVDTVLVAARPGDGPVHGERDLELLRWLAEQAAPFFRHFRTVEGLARTSAPDAKFRAEAVRRREAGQGGGDVVRTSSWAVVASYWLVVAAFAIGVLTLLGVHVDLYSSGPAVLRTSGIDITAAQAGKLATVEVEPGQRVRAGQVLARLDDTEQQVELDRMMRESESTELARLARPSDEHLRAELARLRAEQELARRRLEQRGIVAPADGIVRDVRVEPGKRVDVGEVVFTFAADGTPSEDTIVALLPGGDLPLLAVGQTMRLELAGHRYAYQEAVITSVGSDVLGPAEARRLLGAQVADSLPIAGPVVVVEARAESSSFEIDGMELAYHDGMLARADARLRSERLVIALVPELRRALDWGERG